jgi:hypothetical protein
VRIVKTGKQTQHCTAVNAGGLKPKMLSREVFQIGGYKLGFDEENFSMPRSTLLALLNSGT